MMYVDDEALSSLTPMSLQAKISKRADYFRDNGTLPNVGKTEVMIKDYIKLEVSPGCLKE